MTQVTYLLTCPDTPVSGGETSDRWPIHQHGVERNGDYTGTWFHEDDDRHISESPLWMTRLMSSGWEFYSRHMDF